MLTAISVGLGAIAFVLGGSLLLGKKGQFGGKGGTMSLLSSPSSQSISENDKSLAEQYQRDSVITSSSPQPYISSQEIVRPQDVSLGADSVQNVSYSSAEEKQEKTGNFFPFINPVKTFVGGYLASDILDVASDVIGSGKSSKWKLVFLVVGGIVLYKVVFDG